MHRQLFKPILWFQPMAKKKKEKEENQERLNNSESMACNGSQDLVGYVIESCCILAVKKDQLQWNEVSSITREPMRKL